MIRLPKLNIALFNEVNRYIEEEPQRLWMETYGKKRSYNTVCCYAGTGLLLSTPKAERDKLFHHNGNMKEGTDDIAQKLFGLTQDEADELFDVTSACIPRSQWVIVKFRLCKLIAKRVKAGDLTAKRIQV